MKHTHLYIIRHGEAVVNVKPIIGGMKGDPGLTERGVAQVESLRDRLAATGEIEADVVISSTLPRARQTAEILAPALGKPITWDDDFQEIRVGESDGLTHKEAWERYGIPDFEVDPLRLIAPGGENWEQFSNRIRGAFQRVTNEHQGKTVVIVAHGGIIEGSFAYFLNVNTRTPVRLEFHSDNASLTAWEQYTYKSHLCWRLTRYNDIAHLRDIGVQEALPWGDMDPEAIAHEVA